jgi:predicted dithiol-disulfide oxidoreductase (DUF899 family)
MSLPRIASRDEWLAARTALMADEKELTRRRDALNAKRRELPMVEVTKDYAFEGPSGTVSLGDLFEGRPQLIVYDFMFHPDWDEGCSSCTAGVDEVSPGFLAHLHTRDTTYALVSRAPLEKLERYKAKKGWTLPWYSTNDGDFTYDFGTTIDASRGYDSYNFRTLEEFAAIGQESMRDSEQPYDMPGQSCFLQVDGRVFHTYSVYARGLEGLGGSYYFLDNTALGRQEDWEEPKGRSASVRANVPDFST